MRIAIIAAWVLLLGGAQALPFGGGKEERTLSTTQYEISVQRNGRVDVRTVAGRASFHDAEPLVWFEGDDDAETFDLDGRRSMRQGVSDRLGRGQGLVLAGDDCQWQINAYVSQPFFTVQVLYRNDSRKAVDVRALSPWSAGRRAGALRLGGSVRDARTLALPSPFEGERFGGQMASALDSSDFVMAVQPISPASLAVAGFLGAGDAVPRIRWGRTEDAEFDEYDVFQAVCIYDPPVTVQPGETLSSEVFYVALRENDAAEALRRYGHAVATAGLVPQGPRRPMHGWDPFASVPGATLTAEELLREMDAVANELRPWGWQWFHLPLRGSPGAAGLEPEEGLYPEGVERLVREAHERGLKAALHGAPLSGSLDLTAYKGLERLRRFAGQVTDWGFDGLVLRAPMAPALSESAAGNATRMRLAHEGLRALQTGFADPRRIATVGGYPLPGLYAQTGINSERAAPAFRLADDGHRVGFREATADWARQWFFAPYLWTQAPGYVYFDRPALRERWGVPEGAALTFEQSRAAMTLAALSGGPVLFGNKPSELTEDELDVLRKLLPGPRYPAQPLFPLYEDPPSTWAVAEQGAWGELTVAAVVNWGEARRRFQVRLPELGLKATALYTVYDFWSDALLGVARRDLNVTVPAGGVRVLGFRELKQRPFFLAANHHLLQGALECGASTWDAAARTLSGDFKAAADRGYGLRFYAPEGYEAVDVSWQGRSLPWGQAGRVVHTRIEAAEGATGGWTVRFAGGEATDEEGRTD